MTAGKRTGFEKKRRKKAGRSILLTVMLILVSALFQYSSMFSLKTSVDSRFPGDFRRSLRDYKMLSKLTKSGNFPVPGLGCTHLGDDFCNVMTPQGICTTDDYVLITAYCRAGEYTSDLKRHGIYPQNAARFINERYLKRHRDHHSVIFVMNRKTGQYLATLELPDVNHVGGAAFDGSRVWIAKSSDYELSCLNINTIDKAVESGKDTQKIKYDENVVCDRMASFVTYFKNRLWVGFCNADENGTGVLDGFEIRMNEKGKLSLVSSKELSIPYNANGASFAGIKGKVCLAVSVSGGRGSWTENRDSKLFLYQVDLTGDSDIRGYKYYGSYTMPPLMEEIEIDGSDVYFLFESGSSAYSLVAGHACYRVVDRVCIGKLKDLFYWFSVNYSDPFERSSVQRTDTISTATEAAAVPAYVKTEDKRSPQPLYAPYTAQMAYVLSKGDYQYASDPAWINRLSAYGYMQIYATRSFGKAGIAYKKEDDGSVKAYKANANALAGIKKLYYNGNEKFCIMIAIRGSSVTEAAGGKYEEKYDKSGINSGISRTADEFFSIAKHMKFRTDKKKMSLTDILKLMKKSSSRYKIIMCGYGYGGSTASYITEQVCKKYKVYQGNISAYTFGAPCYRKAPEKSADNIFNIVNADDACSGLLGKYRAGRDMVFTPDLSFRLSSYAEDGKITSARSGTARPDNSGDSSDSTSDTAAGYDALRNRWRSFWGINDGSDSSKDTYTGERTETGDTLRYTESTGQEDAAVNIRMYAGQLPQWWRKAENAYITGYTASGYDVYRGVLMRINTDITNYCPYNTSGDNIWDRKMYIDEDCYRCFDGGFIVKNRGITVKDGVDAVLHVTGASR